MACIGQDGLEQPGRAGQPPWVARPDCWTLGNGLAGFTGRALSDLRGPWTWVFLLCVHTRQEKTQPLLKQALPEEIEVRQTPLSFLDGDVDEEDLDEDSMAF